MNLITEWWIDLRLLFSPPLFVGMRVVTGRGLLRTEETLLDEVVLLAFAFSIDEMDVMLGGLVGVADSAAFG